MALLDRLGHAVTQNSGGIPYDSRKYLFLYEAAINFT